MLSSPAELNEFLKKYGRDGMRLLVLFNLLKPKVKAALQERPHPPIPEGALNRFCMATARKLLLQGRDEVSEKDIEELLSRVNKRRA
jgi:thiamine phosphate synthase YjbQ (UPF0047 family)